MSAKKTRQIVPVQLSSAQAEQLNELSVRSGHSKQDLLRFFIGLSLERFAGKPRELVHAIVDYAERLANLTKAGASGSPAPDDDGLSADTASSAAKRHTSSTKKG